MEWKDLTDEEKKKRLYVLNNNLLLQHRQNMTPVSGDSGGSQAPLTVVLTSNAVAPQSSPFTLTITFSEATADFVVGDITVGFASLSSFATSDNIVYTCTVTPSGVSNDVTLSVLAGVCQSSGGSLNEASNTLTIAQFQSDQVGVNTTGDGKQVFLVVGDSIANGSNNSSGPGPTPAAGTVQQWNGSSVIDIGAADVHNIPVGGGTFMPKMGIDYNTNTGRIPVFIPLGSSGAEFSPNGDNNNWSSTGTLRAGAQTQVTNCLASLSLTQLRGIVVILGVNDARAVTTLATVQADIDAFFTWLTTTYPNVPIQVCQVGRTESVVIDNRTYTVRERIVSNAISKPMVQMAFNIGSWINSAGYGADNLHPTQTGNNNLGASLAMWWTNLSYTKWARSVMSAMYGSITSGRKTLVQNFINSIGTDLFLLENLHLLKVSNANDIGSDWTFLQLLHLNTGTVNLNTNLSVNGVDQSFETTFNTSISILRSSQTDVFTIAKIADNGNTSATTLFGVSNARFYRLTQQAIQYVVNDGTTRSTATSVFADNHSYGIFRDGTTKGLLDNGVVTDSIVTASTGTVNRNMRFGAFNGGSLSQFGDFEFEWVVSGKYSTINIANLVSSLNTLTSGW
jgi:hypothetical protein